MTPPMPPGGGDQPMGPPSPEPSAPSQAPANPKQIILAQVSQALKNMAASDPVLSAGLQKAVQGIQEAQTAMLTQPRPMPTESSPPV